MRKVISVTVPNDPRYARDIGKTYQITEMPASQAEEWAMKAIGAMSRSGADIPPEFLAGGWAVVAMVGLKAIFAASFEDAKPLLDEMMGCVMSVQTAAVRPMIEEDIEEVSTRVWLRDQVFACHAGFSVIERLSNILAMARAPIQEDDTPNTLTSPEPSESWSLTENPPSTS
jgi:hypothetical protein